MKAYTLLTIHFITFIFAIRLGAQTSIPNGGFENWTNNGAYQSPDLWATLNGTTVSTGVYTCEQGAPGIAGSSYLKLTSKKNNSGTVVQGIAVCGTLNTTSIQPTGGFSFTQRPVNLTGSWQFMYGSTSSRGYVDVKLTRWDNTLNQRVTVASLHNVLSGMVMSWTNFSLPLTYSDTGNPDTCIVVLAASSATPMENDYLYVDNLGFDGYSTGVTSVVNNGGGTTGTEQQNINNYVKLFPNPATLGEITVETSDNKTGLLLFIYDIVGTLVKSETITQSQQKINIEGLTNGCYIVIVKNENLSLNKKLIIQR